MSGWMTFFANTLNHFIINKNHIYCTLTLVVVKNKGVKLGF